jgi:Glutaminase
MPPTREEGIVTVATIREETGRVLFNEKEQIFTLPETAARGAISDRLREGLGAGAPVRVVLDPSRGIVLETAPAGAATDEWARSRTFLDHTSEVVRIRVGEIDPTQFNVVDLHLRWPLFDLCDDIVPDYAKAKEIFDFCVAQSCHLPTPPTVTPCIPFQYVRDGCYARAHKMRWIIENKYGYCCEKVFSFANQNNDELSVRADKWGGCCVTWWYHVVPLLRMRVSIGDARFTVALVIDPGMFDKPVLLSSWLAAQENQACSANAKVSMYSIQPGSAYAPANYQGTAFTTDPNYTATDATLVQYQNLTTC